MARPIFPIPTIASRRRHAAISLAEERGVQPLHRRLHLLVVDDHREIDAGRAQRQHVHAHVAERAERAGHRLAAVGDRSADHRDDPAVSLDRHVAERAEIADDRLEAARRRRP